MPDDLTPASSAPVPAPARPRLGEQLLRRKPLEAFAREAEASDARGLRRTLGVWHLTAISIGATLGTGNSSSTSGSGVLGGVFGRD